MIMCNRCWEQMCGTCVDMPQSRLNSVNKLRDLEKGIDWSCTGCQDDAEKKGIM